MTAGCPMLNCSIVKSCLRKHDCRASLSPREYALSQFARIALGGVAAGAGPFGSQETTKSCGGVESRHARADEAESEDRTQAARSTAGVAPGPQDTSLRMVAVGLGYREMIAIALEMYAVFATGFICGAATIGLLWWIV